MKKDKYVAIGILIGFCLSLPLSTFAESVITKVEAYFRPDFNVAVNGEKINLTNIPVTVNGSMYLPLRELGNVLGYNVNWDEASKTAELTEPAGNPNKVSGDNKMNPITNEQTKKTFEPEIIENYINVNGYVSPGLKYNGKTFVWLHAAAEKHGVTFEWRDGGVVINGKITIHLDEKQGLISPIDPEKIEDAFYYYGKPFVNEQLIIEAKEAGE